MKERVHLIGFAAGIAGNNSDCALGPWYLYYHPEWFEERDLSVSWKKFIKARSVYKGFDVFPEVERILKKLSQKVLDLARERSAFAVIGGDHSSAIGTWSAVAHANRDQGDIGLIWIDAHMDSHTTFTSHTQNIHGMPLAALLGHGQDAFCHLLDDRPKLKPQNVTLIGVRSYEAAEQALLEQLGVRIYYMDEVRSRGLHCILNEAYKQVTAQTCGMGISIDMDAIDPSDAPGVGYQEPGGLAGSELLEALKSIPWGSNRLLGVELTEYNPIEDMQHKTAHLLIDLLKAVIS